MHTCLGICVLVLVGLIPHRGLNCCPQTLDAEASRLAEGISMAEGSAKTTGNRQSITIYQNISFFSMTELVLSVMIIVT